MSKQIIQIVEIKIDSKKLWKSIKKTVIGKWSNGEVTTVFGECFIWWVMFDKYLLFKEWLQEQVNINSNERYTLIVI